MFPLQPDSRNLISSLDKGFDAEAAFAAILSGFVMLVGAVDLIEHILCLIVGLVKNRGDLHGLSMVSIQIEAIPQAKAQKHHDDRHGHEVEPEIWTDDLTDEILSSHSLIIYAEMQSQTALRCSHCLR